MHLAFIAGVGGRLQCTVARTCGTATCAFGVARRASEIGSGPSLSMRPCMQERQTLAATQKVGRAYLAAGHGTLAYRITR